MHRVLLPWLVVVVACSGGGSSAELTSAPTTALATTTSSTTAEATTTSAATTTIASTTTATPEPPTEVAWTTQEAERHVANYLAALAAGAYEQAAWSAHGNGIQLDGQADDELPADYLRRQCAGEACVGPYEVVALGPGLVDPTTAQASSGVRVTHISTGEEKVFNIGTFEGQLVIDDLPPLVPSEPSPGLVESLFGSDMPVRVVAQRFNAFEIWKGGSGEWVTNWWADGAHDVEGDWAAVRHRGLSQVVQVRDPSVAVESECPELMSRNGQVLVLERCWADEWRMFDPDTGEETATPVPFKSLEDGETVYFIERARTVVQGLGDAEGNLTDLTTSIGIDLLGDDYAGLAALSVDGRSLAYVDHADPAALNHFWSPVVAVRDTSTGEELGRWTVDHPIGCIEFANSWLVVCEMGEDPSYMEPHQVALVAINTESGDLNRVVTRTRLFLP